MNVNVLITRSCDNLKSWRICGLNNYELLSEVLVEMGEQGTSSVHILDEEHQRKMKGAKKANSYKL